MRLVPWCSWDEWQQVRCALLAGGEGGAGPPPPHPAPPPLDEAAALRRCAVWRLRGRVPLSVDVTAALVEAAAADAQGSLSDLSLRSLYSLSLVRLVNGVTDPAQRGRSAAPVASLARAAGLPPLLVELRHQASHNALPQLPVLRTAAALARLWCREHYWAPQAALLAARRADTAASLRQLLACARLVPAARARRGGARAGEAEEEEAEEEEAEAAEEEAEAEAEEAAEVAPSASLKRRRLGAALRALSRLVPPAAPQQLLSPLLDDVLLSEEWQAAPPGARVDALRALARRWPNLPWLLLAGAAARLAAAAGAEGGGAQAARLSLLLRSLLLPAAQAGLGERRRRALRLALLASPARCAAGAAAAAEAAEAVAAAGGGAEPPAPASELEAAEEEMRQLKRRRAAGGEGEGGWTRVQEWEAVAVGAPPAWLVTADGAPELGLD